MCVMVHSLLRLVFQSGERLVALMRVFFLPQQQRRLRDCFLARDRVYRERAAAGGDQLVAKERSPFDCEAFLYGAVV